MTVTNTSGLGLARARLLELVSVPKYVVALWIGHRKLAAQVLLMWSAPPLCLALLYGRWPLVLLALLVGLLPTALLARSLAATERVAAQATVDPAWHVLVNGTALGTLTRTEEALLRREVLLDQHMHEALWMDFVAELFKGAFRFFMQLGSFFGLLLLLWVLLDPGSLRDFLQAYLKAPPADMRSVQAFAYSVVFLWTTAFVIVLTVFPTLKHLGRIEASLLRRVGLLFQVGRGAHIELLEAHRRSAGVHP